MSSNNSGVGCGGLIVILVFIGLIVEYLVEILAFIALVCVLAVVGALAWGAAQGAAEAAAQRRRCKVCNNWTPSVILTELGTGEANALCQPHLLRLQRITSLEQELLDPP